MHFPEVPGDKSLVAGMLASMLCNLLCTILDIHDCVVNRVQQSAPDFDGCCGHICQLYSMTGGTLKGYHACSVTRDCKACETEKTKELDATKHLYARPTRPSRPLMFFLSCLLSTPRYRCCWNASLRSMRLCAKQQLQTG